MLDSMIYDVLTIPLAESEQQKTSFVTIVALFLNTVNVHNRSFSVLLTSL